VEAPEEIEAYECNCSICGKVAFLHLTVPKSRFSLIRGEGDIVTYTFNMGRGCVPAERVVARDACGG
jgi:hypothetical protein